MRPGLLHASSLIARARFGHFYPSPRIDLMTTKSKSKSKGSITSIRIRKTRSRAAELALIERTHPLALQPPSALYPRFTQTFDPKLTLFLSRGGKKKQQGERHFTTLLLYHMCFPLHQNSQDVFE
jgi:hypothetical protein